MCEHVQVCVCAHECRYLGRQEEGVGSPGLGVISGCELPYVVQGDELRSSIRATLLPLYLRVIEFFVAHII